MENKKKNVLLGAFLSISVVLVLVFVVLTNSEDVNLFGDDEITATFVVDFLEADTETVEVQVEEGSTMLAAMEEYLDAEAEDGFVYSVMGEEQDMDENIFWVYDINGEMGLEGAADYVLQDGDIIEWTLSEF